MQFTFIDLRILIRFFFFNITKSKIRKKTVPQQQWGFNSYRCQGGNLGLQQRDSNISLPPPPPSLISITVMMSTLNPSLLKYSKWLLFSDWTLLLLLLLLLSLFSCVWLCATPWTAPHQAPPSLGFSRQEHWSGLPFPSPMHESEQWKWSRSVVSDS